jgi:hypothetical protein
MSDDEVKKEIKEDHINIKVKDMVRVMRSSTTRARAQEKIDVCLKVDCLTSSVVDAIARCVLTIEVLTRA